MGCMCSGPGDCCENVGFYLSLVLLASVPRASSFELQQLYKYDGYLCAVLQGSIFVLGVTIAACRAGRLRRRRTRIQVQNMRGSAPTAPPPTPLQPEGRLFGSEASRRGRRGLGAGGADTPKRRFPRAAARPEAVEVEVRPLRPVLGRVASGGSPRRSLPPGVHRRVSSNGSF